LRQFGKRSTAGRAILWGWWEQIVVSLHLHLHLHLRFRAGVFCVLMSALLMIGSAGCGVAVADPGSSGSRAHGSDTDQQQSTGAENPKKNGTDAKVEKKDSTDIPLITVLRLERGHQRNDALATNYHQRLTAA